MDEDTKWVERYGVSWDKGKSGRVRQKSLDRYESTEFEKADGRTG